MHEVSLVAQLVEACEQRAAGRPVRVAHVRHASSLPEATVRQAFDLLTTGTTLADARLELSSFAIELRCPCGFVGPVEHDHEGDPWVLCPSCDEVVSRPRTPELELVRVVT